MRDDAWVVVGIFAVVNFGSALLPTLTSLHSGKPVYGFGMSHNIADELKF
jgi:hypothetical protein